MDHSPTFVSVHDLYQCDLGEMIDDSKVLICQIEQVVDWVSSGRQCHLGPLHAMEGSDSCCDVSCCDVRRNHDLSDHFLGDQ